MLIVRTYQRRKEEEPIKKKNGCEFVCMCAVSRGVCSSVNFHDMHWMYSTFDHVTAA